MRKDKLRLYILELILLVILFTALIVSNKITYIILALVLGIYALIVKNLLKKKKIHSIYRKQVAFLMFVFGIVYLIIFYLLGIYINDFVKQPILFNFKTLYRYILPLIVIITSTEIIRSSFLSIEGKIRIFNKSFDLSKIFSFINMVLIDLIIYIGVYDLTNFNDFMTAMGFILFASISCNLYYNYVSNRYGSFGIVLYRMITVLYVYIIPIVPNIYIYFRAFLRVIYPYLMYLFLEHTYSKTSFVVPYREKRKNIIGVTVLVVVMTLITMLISCRFRYGILVVGSDSMTGSINKGDAVIYDSYDNQNIKKEQVIVFEKNGVKLIHRVIDIVNINGEVRYYTKGDNNEERDAGYITDSNIIGLVELRVMYVGYPTIWIRNLFL
ncbi:MAG: signal peptidase I [Bacilli bacterium]|nr:signal peptidase I [Bacilli bacterium]